MRSQKEWVVPQRHFRMPAKKVAKPEQPEEDRSRQQQQDTERYQLQIDRQTKRSFKTLKLRGLPHWKSNPVFRLCRSPFMTA